MRSRGRFAIVCAGAIVLAKPAFTQDTLFLNVGSPQIDGSVFKPHAARVRVYDGRGVQTAEWDNELYLGDSAGRPVMRWVTTGRVVPGSPNRPLGRLVQTYDGKTLAPYGFLLASSTGAFTQLAIHGTSVRGVKRSGPRAPIEEVSHGLDAPGFYSGASDLVPVAAGLRTGTIVVAPLWTSDAKQTERRVFVIRRDTSLSVEGTTVIARKVDEYRRSDRTLMASWYLTREPPYMVYGEVPMPNGSIQRMTEVPLPHGQKP